MKTIFFLLTLLLFVSCDFTDEGKAEYHHLYPQQFREYFNRSGIDIDQNTIKITKETHRGAGRGIHSKQFNKNWKKFIEANPNASKSDIEKHGKLLLTNMGFKGRIDYYDYVNKVKVGRAIYCSKNKFLSFCALIGRPFSKGTGWLAIIGNFLGAVGAMVLGWFGIEAEHPVAVGAGIIFILVALCMLIGLFLLFKWLIIGGGFTLILSYLGFD